MDLAHAEMLSGTGMSDLAFTHLTERPEDAIPIERLNERTFGPGRYARTAYRIREKLGHRMDLSYTARVGTLLVGSIRLTSPDPRKAPAIRFNYMSHAADWQDFRTAIRLTRGIFAQKAFDEYRGAEIAPGKAAQCDAALDDFVREIARFNDLFGDH